MAHGIYRVVAFRVVGQYTIEITFDDGLVQTVNFEPVLRGQVFGPLRDPDLFGQVAIDEIAHTLVWPNDADFDPETLHNWPDYAEDMAATAASWENAPVSVP